MRAAQRRATAKLGAGHAKFIADDPQQWGVGFGLRRDSSTVDLKFHAQG